MAFEIPTNYEGVLTGPYEINGSQFDNAHLTAVFQGAYKNAVYEVLGGQAGFESYDATLSQWRDIWNGCTYHPKGGKTTDKKLGCYPLRNIVTAKVYGEVLTQSLWTFTQNGPQVIDSENSKSVARNMMFATARNLYNSESVHAPSITAFFEEYEEFEMEMTNAKFININILGNPTNVLECDAYVDDGAGQVYYSSFNFGDDQILPFYGFATASERTLRMGRPTGYTEEQLNGLKLSWRPFGDMVFNEPKMMI